MVSNVCVGSIEFHRPGVLIRIIQIAIPPPSHLKLSIQVVVSSLVSIRPKLRQRLLGQSTDPCFLSGRASVISVAVRLQYSPYLEDTYTPDVRFNPRTSCIWTTLEFCALIIEFTIPIRLVAIASQSTCKRPRAFSSAVKRRTNLIGSGISSPLDTKAWLKEHVRNVRNSTSTRHIQTPMAAYPDWTEILLAALKAFSRDCVAWEILLSAFVSCDVQDFASSTPIIV